jgi:acetoacetyl-CoA reductase
MGGLGEAICMKMADMGYEVATTHSPGNTKVSAWLEEMKAKGYHFRAYPCDVASFESAQECISQITKDMGPVDVLVNNAGITRDMTFKKMDKVNWDVVMKTNLDSVFNMTKPVCDGMTDRGWGRIINISSVNGLGNISIPLFFSKTAISFNEEGVLTESFSAANKIELVSPGKASAT